MGGGPPTALGRGTGQVWAAGPSCWPTRTHIQVGHKSSLDHPFPATITPSLSPANSPAQAYSGCEGGLASHSHNYTEHTASEELSTVAGLSSMPGVPTHSRRCPRDQGMPMPV